jgi:hypothetical protein
MDRSAAPDGKAEGVGVVLCGARHTHWPACVPVHSASRHQEPWQAAGTPTVAWTSHPQELCICAWRLDMGRKGDRRGATGIAIAAKSDDWDGTEGALLPIRV